MKTRVKADKLLNVRIGAALKTRLQEAATLRGVTMSDLTITAIERIVSEG